MVFLLQKGECNLKKPYHSVLNMSLSVLMLPYYVHLLYRTAGGGFRVNGTPYECLGALVWCSFVSLNYLNLLSRVPGVTERDRSWTSKCDGDALLPFGRESKKQKRHGIRAWIIKGRLLRQSRGGVTCNRSDASATTWGAVNNKCSLWERLISRPKHKSRRKAEEHVAKKKKKNRWINV